MPASPYQHTATADLADTLLGLALMAPQGSVKGELAFTAALLTGRGAARADSPDLTQSVQLVRDALAARFLGGADGATASAISHIDEALRLLSDCPSSLALQAQPVSGE